jgi:hypothetical protein
METTKKIVEQLRSNPSMMDRSVIDATLDAHNLDIRTFEIHTKTLLNECAHVIYLGLSIIITFLLIFLLFFGDKKKSDYDYMRVYVIAIFVGIVLAFIDYRNHLFYSQILWLIKDDISTETI